MSEFLDMHERVGRLNHITAGAKISEDHGLLKMFPLGTAMHDRLVFALNQYLYVNLNQWHRDKSFNFSNNMLAEYGDEILQLPNITPNGLILPKVENCLAYNFLHSEFALAFADIGMGHEIQSIQFPINIRIKDGLPDPVVDQRPLSSTKPHTDIWAGDSAGAMLVFLSLLGDPGKAGIDFLYVPNFPKKFAVPLKDYESGKEVVENAEKLPAKFVNGKWYMIDAYLVHQTIKRGKGLRISIDVRFMPKTVISSDTKGAEERLKLFTTFDKWSKVGTEYWVTTNQSMKDKPKPEYDFCLVDFPRNLNTSTPS